MGLHIGFWGLYSKVWKHIKGSSNERVIIVYAIIVYLYNYVVTTKTGEIYITLLEKGMHKNM